MFPQKPKPKEFRSAYRPSVRFVAICMTIAFLASFVLLSGITGTNQANAQNESTSTPPQAGDNGGDENWVTGETGLPLAWKEAKNERSGLHTKSGIWGQMILDILNIFLAIVNWLAGLGGRILDWVITQTKFTDIPVVKESWTIVRDLANMFFALALLVIAFATILHLESYGMKQLLWKLVVAALLINFSFVIGGAVIDFTNMMMKFFIQSSAGSASISGDIVLKGLSAGQLYSGGQNPQAGGFFWRYGSALISGGPTYGMIVEAFCMLILLSVLAYALLASAFILLIRIIVLWLILIFAPLAWFAMILPATSFLWQRWWKELLRYSFVAPVLTFFLYLALQVVQSGALRGLDAPPKITPFSNSFLSTPQLLMQFFFVMILLIAGVRIARLMSVAGADAAVKMGGTAKSFALGAVTGGVGMAAGWGISRYKVATAPMAERMGKGMAQKAGEWRQRTGWRAAYARPAAYLAGQASRIPLAYSTTGRQEIEDAKKGLDTYSNDALKALAPSLAPKGKAAALEIFAKRGKGDIINDLKEHLPVVARRGVDKDAIVAVAPHLAKEVGYAPEKPGEEIKEATKKAWKKGTVGQMSEEAFKNPEVAGELASLAKTNQSFANIVNSLPEHLKEAMTTGLDQAIKNNPTDFDLRSKFASATGDLHTAFVKTPDANLIDIARHIQTMTPQQIAQIKETDKNSFELFAKHLTDIQAANIGRSGIVPAQHMAEIKVHVLANNYPAKEYLESSEAWGAQRPKPKPKEEKPPLYDASGRLIR